MGAPAVFTAEQVAFIRKKYMAQPGKGRADDVVAVTNAKFPGLNVVKKQIYNLARDRGWTTIRREAKIKALESSQDVALVQQEKTLAVQAMIDGHKRLGQKIAQKAELFVDGATSAKTLSSAASAAKTGISIVRDAMGLGSHTSVSQSALTFNFAWSEGSPFVAKSVQPVEEAIDV